jgi:hypothetical protein
MPKPSKAKLNPRMINLMMNVAFQRDKRNDGWNRRLDVVSERAAVEFCLAHFSSSDSLKFHQSEKP